MKVKKKNIYFNFAVFVKKYPYVIAFAMLLGFLNSSAIYIPMMKIMKTMVEYVTGEERGDAVKTVMNLVMLCALYYLYNFAIEGLRHGFSMLKSKLNAKISAELQMELVGKITKTQADCLEDSTFYMAYEKCKNIGISKIVDAPYRMCVLLANVISIVLFLLFSLDIHIMAVLLIVFSEFIKGIIFRKIKYEKVRYDIEINDIDVKLDTFLKSILDKEHMMEIKLYDSIDYINRQRMGLYGEVKKKFISLLKKDILLSLFMFLIEKACYYGVFICYAYITILEYITLGSFVYVVDMIEKISSSVSGVFSSFAAFSESRIYFDEMDTVYAFPNYRSKIDSSREGRVACVAEDKNIAVKKIETKSLGYQYPNSDYPALCDVSCELRMNKKICLVGANGSGKSTFAKIISGLYEQYTGTVLMDGCDFRSIDNEDLFSQIDFGQQKLIKYPFSFQYNICFDKYEEQKFKDSVKECLLEEVINKTSKGQNTCLDRRYNEDGIDLSEGQWQKILLARLLYADKKMLVFDEPTASLDPIAESRIIDKILSIKEKLIIIISHRMACAMQMDDIIVFSEGKIVEKGNHEDLMNRKGMYFRMFTEQSKKYEVI